MLEKLKEINSKRSVEKISMVLIIVAILHLLNVFAVYYSTKLNLSNPLIPKCLAFEIFNPYAEKGFILAFGLLIATFSKFLKQNLIVITICLLILVLYYLTGFEPNFEEYPK
ncbi:hypothetical protein [Flavobacterium reichenbachii]|uniref:Uncharacterized protein n=1 Tax=Flavobacterium reichenbachii TaxID=362418 RepID=A0A085ZNJ2_9FLAO|nr:hypothetical protein [Flavobacterium reichenbachii]KFF06006.1 hypothetical protein IW19_10935 [Flavobacterium reichenbachii]OXB14768.1 hypothetical protein B0A68_12000 [Flavobacterium reichenbachii]